MRIFLSLVSVCMCIVMFMRVGVCSHHLCVFMRVFVGVGLVYVCVCSNLYVSLCLCTCVCLKSSVCA